MSEKTLLSGLVDRQQDAVTHTSGPLLIRAGAGTGKTTTITAKIAYMVRERGIDPKQILALTFSRAAAANMRSQVDELLNGISDVQVSTFHSFCAGIIRDNADKCGVHQDFSILEDVDTAVILHRDLGVGIRDALLYTSSISKAKDLNITIEMLDEFKSAGVFVNWWQQIRYDLKTIISTGWHHSLIPDDYLIAEFFQPEAGEIETLEGQISEVQSELAEAVETAQEVAAYEPDEGEKVSAAVIKKALKALIDDLKGSTCDSAQKELANLQAQDRAIKTIEKRIKDSKATLKTKTDELEHKLQLKRLGGDDFKAES
ncbi:MAG: UvrD-helicase domain-containing protein, partial [Euryarchaeota archaeon]|nr:UvrD-helicase domain-containing protein [Euryarchaeota archaeon]